MATTVAMRNVVATAYAGVATHGAVYTTAPGASAGTEVSGGSPPYARKALSWSAASGGSVQATASFDIPAGATVRGVGVHSAATGGTYYDGDTVTDQPYATQGVLQVTFVSAHS